MAAQMPDEVVPFVHEGLGNSSYLVDVGQGEAIVVDPDRTAHRYLEAAEARELQIAAVLETHIHADFVTGALEIRDRAGATLFHAAEGGPSYPHVGLRGGDRLELGDIEVEVRPTPSHTPEHLSFIVRGGDRAAPLLAFTGGALIVGGAARTDLISPELTHPLTRALFREARRAFDDLPDETVVLPTHGGGSFCSSGATEERASTLGGERKANSVLTYPGDEDGFVAWFPTTFPGVPSYYARMRSVNAAGPRPLSEIPPSPALEPIAFVAANAAGALAVDVRRPEAFAAGHVPGALAVPLREEFCVWLGWLVPADEPILFVTDDLPLEHVLEEARLVGYERFGGWLRGGMDAWRDASLPLATSGDLTPVIVAERLTMGAVAVDVREPDEVAGGTIEGAVAIPLGSLESRVSDEVQKNRPVIAFCAAGERSTSAVSILEREGFTFVATMTGGFDEWREAGLPVGSPSA